MTKPSFFIKITSAASTALAALAAILISPAIAQSFNNPPGENDTLIKFLKAEHTPSRPLLPESFIIKDKFRPSTQSFAGTIMHLQGTAYVYHQNEQVAYSIQQDHPVFSGDTLVTTEKSKATLQLADDSVLFLTAHTKLLIDRFLPRVNVRDTAMYLFFGKIRSTVQRDIGEYTIKTPTACLKVRGTDFIVAVAPASPKKPTKLLTAVLTGSGQSNVDFAGFVGPSITLKPFSVAGIGSGSQAEKAVSVQSMASFLLDKIVPQEEQKLQVQRVQQDVQKEQKEQASTATEPVLSNRCFTVTRDVGKGKKSPFKVCLPVKKPKKPTVVQVQRVQQDVPKKQKEQTSKATEPVLSNRCFTVTRDVGKGKKSPFKVCLPVKKPKKPTVVQVQRIQQDVPKKQKEQASTATKPVLSTRCFTVTRDVGKGKKSPFKVCLPVKKPTASSWPPKNTESKK
ncbi:MAG: hypothetical protein D3915_03585 [Candidatus Electrothrix sp. AU1_5]|nr:hypothetical protein [Candidatus Electrothrix gigas]